MARGRAKALPPLPWLTITAGNGPRPAGLKRTPARSYAPDDSTARYDHVAPPGLAGPPVSTKPDEDAGVVDEGETDEGDVVPSRLQAASRIEQASAVRARRRRGRGRLSM